MSSNNAETVLEYYPERITVDELKSFPDHIGRYRFALQWVPGRRVLDVPCGTGYGTVLLAVAGATEVLGIDISEEAVDHARKGFVPPTARFEVMNAMQMPFEREFDLVTCFEGIEHVPDPECLTAGIARALKPEGVALISTPNAAGQAGGHSGNPHHVREFYPEEFKQLMEAHFGRVKLYYQRRSDPLDAPWSITRALKQLCPGPVRRLLSGMRGKPAAGGASAGATSMTTEEWLAPTVDDVWYPRAWNYLGYPGMEPDFCPHVLVAVCQTPKRSAR